MPNPQNLKRLRMCVCVVDTRYHVVIVPTLRKNRRFSRTGK